MGIRNVGARVKRREDQQLLTGNARFTDDIDFPGTLTAYFVRSQMAHARIRSVAINEARAHPGVVAIWLHPNLPETMRDKDLPLHVPVGHLKCIRGFPVLAHREVKYVGEAVAVILADSRQIAEDASELVVIDYEPLPCAVDCRDSVKPGAAIAHSDAADNIAADFHVGFNDIEGAFADAPIVIKESFWQHRGLCHAMECRAVIAKFEEEREHLTLWTAGQTPHLVRNMLIEMLGHPDEKIQVITPDVGGGFGPKGIVYPEEAVVAALTMHFKRPVRWTEDRREHAMATTQERDQLWTVELAADETGKILGIRGDLIHDAGAYVVHGVVNPLISATTLPGPYVLPAYYMRVRSVFTNKPPVSPLRGAGRPQAVFVMERLLDRLAERTGLDRAEVRERNLIQPEQMPYAVGLTFRDGSPLTYDSGDYPKCQKVALDMSNYGSFPARQEAARQAGRYIGIGIANYVEGTGLGPFESGKARVLPDGRINVSTGASPQGQGHKTMLAQVAADAFGADIDDIEVTVGDTSTNNVGMGTFASRTAVTAGSSIHLAAGELRIKTLKLAAHYLEEDPDNLTINGRNVVTVQQSNKVLPLSKLYKIAKGMPGISLPNGVEPGGLVTTSYFMPPSAAYANGAHVAEVEVDPETGGVTILRYCVAHDCGRIINPLIVDGQIQGGVAHGVGNALFEEMRFDDQGQPLTVTLAEYLLPMAPNVPDVEIAHIETLSPINPLGVKGAGEGGTIPAAAAIISAVENALSPFGVRISQAPITPSRICELIDAGASVAPQSSHITSQG